MTSAKGQQGRLGARPNPGGTTRIKKTCWEISKDFFTPEHVDISTNHFWYTMKAEIKKLPVVPKIKERTALAGFGLAAVLAHKKSGKGGEFTQCNVNFHPPTIQQVLVHEKRQVTMAAVCLHTKFNLRGATLSYKILKNLHSKLEKLIKNCGFISLKTVK